MKKIVIILIFIFLSLGLIFTGIFIKKEIIDKKIDVDELLIKVMNSERKFTDENGNDLLFKDYMFYNNTYYNLIKYSFVDLDEDNINELITYVETSVDVDAYMVFRYNVEEKKVYGYMSNIREFMGLKKDGTFYGSSGAGVQGYYKIQFENNVKVESEIAYVNHDFEKYRINNKNVSKEEALEFVNEWYNRENCIWETEKIKKLQ